MENIPVVNILERLPVEILYIVLECLREEPLSLRYIADEYPEEAHPCRLLALKALDNFWRYRAIVTPGNIHQAREYAHIITNLTIPCDLISRRMRDLVFPQLERVRLCRNVNHFHQHIQNSPKLHTIELRDYARTSTTATEHQRIHEEIRSIFQNLIGRLQVLRIVHCCGTLTKQILDYYIPQTEHYGYLRVLDLTGSVIPSDPRGYFSYIFRHAARLEELLLSPPRGERFAYPHRNFAQDTIQLMRSRPEAWRMNIRRIRITDQENPRRMDVQEYQDAFQNLKSIELNSDEEGQKDSFTR